jgi:hypothetical protein
MQNATKHGECSNVAVPKMGRDNHLLCLGSWEAASKLIHIACSNPKDSIVFRAKNSPKPDLQTSIESSNV